MFTTKNTLKILLFLSTVTLLFYSLYYFNSSVLVYDKSNEYYNNTEKSRTIFYKVREVRDDSSSQISYVNTLDNQTDSPVLPQRSHINTLDKYDDTVMFPYSNITFKASEILRSQWIIDLKGKLIEANFGKQLTLVVVSFDYFSTLLNWMAHANLYGNSLLKNLLVVCLDEESHNILVKKGIISVVIEPDKIIEKMEKIQRQVFRTRVALRITVLRLLNYLGYSVFQMDIDALLLNNVQPIFDHFGDADILVSKVNAHYCLPKEAFKAWHFCLCVGTVLIRSNRNTGMCY